MSDVYGWVREESRDALRMSEMQRFINCGHQYNRGVCRFCGDDEPRRDSYA